MSSPSRPPTQLRRARERRVFRAGLLISLVIHFAVVGIVGGLLDRPAPPPTRRSLPLILEPPAGTRVVQLVMVEETPGAELEPEIREPEPPPVRVEPPVRIPETRTERRTAAERLIPRLVDPRVWQPMVVLPREPTLDDVRSRIAAALELLSDSALAETDRALRALDWTVKDADGGKWGVSPGQIHLGSVTLPLPIAFPVDARVRERTDEWHEFQAQYERVELVESFEARVKAIRERRDRERRERRTAENGGSGG